MGNLGSLLRRQPFKTLYIAYLFTSTLLFRLPYWCIRYAIPWMRPRRSWSLRKSITVALYRDVLTHLPEKLGLDASHHPPKSDDELRGAKYIRIEGLRVDSPEFCGELRQAANRTGMRSQDVPAYWIFRPGTSVPKDPKAAEGEKVVLHIHGGSFHVCVERFCHTPELC